MLLEPVPRTWLFIRLKSCSMLLMSWTAPWPSTATTVRAPKLALLKVISTLPESFTGVDYKCGYSFTWEGVYASNRDMITWLYIRLSGWDCLCWSNMRQPAVQRRVTLITAVDRFVLVANQDSNNIISYRIDPGSGRLLASGRESMLKLQFICFI